MAHKKNGKWVYEIGDLVRVYGIAGHTSRYMLCKGDVGRVTAAYDWPPTLNVSFDAGEYTVHPMQVRPHVSGKSDSSFGMVQSEDGLEWAIVQHLNPSGTEPMFTTTDLVRIQKAAAMALPQGWDVDELVDLILGSQ